MTIALSLFSMAAVRVSLIARRILGSPIGRSCEIIGLTFSLVFMRLLMLRQDGCRSSGGWQYRFVRFEASIEMVDGVPQVTWSPDLGAERVYRVLGAKGLLPAAFGCVASLGCSGETHRGTVWEIVTEETEGDYKFFKVAVEMP